ncbi:hypothetical protein LTR48_003073 [Friedmanniomyces endolithicus]|uniref:Uncharacterized protein n=1 Tax=Rachicladosporium monterosium TaxID=1507873 RepID=A0ABR0LB76_9PEZI|nr:hypothetical protein LTR29_012115 [Friedmanniomyces endolithicus]KAK1086958.1 hypothetical protein LTR48_003073 [Friedmanniomyces endolithicus]KAK1815836.1 hypothetical protein LTR12_009721 [Friedmanniomyces endolithicus]KAK5145459.1 hypothetical protein LTR32_002778 [Rachicladosporium monterosium]
MTLAGFKDGEVTEADRETERATRMQASGEKTEDRIKNNDEQPHTIIARLQAELALEREKVKEVRRELAEESKRLRRCEWKFHEGEGGGFERVAG